MFTASSIWMSVVGMISGVAVVHYIGPAEMGLWASVALVQTYAAFIVAGVQNGLSRELPYYLGANNEAKAWSLAATSLYYTIATSILTALGRYRSAVVYLLYEAFKSQACLRCYRRHITDHI